MRVDVGTCHQKLVKDNALRLDTDNLFGEWWNDIELGRDRAEVREVSRLAAESIITRYEWLGTLPANYRSYWGLLFEGNLAGVTCFTNVKFGGKYTLFGYDAWSLGRGATVHWCPDWGGSFLVSRSCRKLFNESPPVMVVAYSDWSAGEIGTIYQACNWFYLGHTTTREWIGPDGKRYDINTPAVRAVTGFEFSKTGIKATKHQIDEQARIMVDEGYRLVAGPMRGRYAYPYGRKSRLKDEMLDVLRQKAKPYPKRCEGEL